MAYSSFKNLLGYEIDYIVILDPKIINSFQLFTIILLLEISLLT
jgi:hypothetical protein